MKRNYLKWSVAVGIIATLFVSVPNATHAGTRIYSSSLSSYYTFLRYSRTISYNLPARDLNGISLNGPDLEARHITAVSLENVVIKNKKTTDLDLKGTKLKHLNQLEDALFTAILDDGSPLGLRIDAVEAQPDRADPDVIHYFVSYQTDTGWEPLCGEDDAGMPVGAIPLQGYWDYSEGTETGGSKIEDDTMFTFACDGFVLHKCVDAGYKPWEEVVVCESPSNCDTVSLAAQHQACTRMLRADYCGDGTSYTENGVLVALYDGLGIRVDSEDWDIEAEWDEDGAICMNQDRVETLVPTCMDYLVDETCGSPDHFQDGVLLISELP